MAIEDEPHRVSQEFCIFCGKTCTAVIPEVVETHMLECGFCGKVGGIIEVAIDG